MATNTNTMARGSHQNKPTMEHTYAAIYDRLNNQPHLQEVISSFVLDSLYAEDKQIWETKNKHNQDLMINEWKVFIKCEMDLVEELNVASSWFSYQRCRRAFKT